MIHHAPATQDEITQVLSVILPKTSTDEEFASRLRLLLRIGVLEPALSGMATVNQDHPEFQQALALVRAEGVAH